MRPCRPVTWLSGGVKPLCASAMTRIPQPRRLPLIGSDHLRKLDVQTFSCSAADHPFEHAVVHLRHLERGGSGALPQDFLDVPGHELAALPLRDAMPT